MPLTGTYFESTRNKSVSEGEGNHAEPLSQLQSCMLLTADLSDPCPPGEGGAMLGTCLLLARHGQKQGYADIFLQSGGRKYLLPRALCGAASLSPTSFVTSC